MLNVTELKVGDSVWFDDTGFPGKVIKVTKTYIEVEGKLRTEKFNMRGYKYGTSSVRFYTGVMLTDEESAKPIRANHLKKFWIRKIAKLSESTQCDEILVLGLRDCANALESIMRKEKDGTI